MTLISERIIYDPQRLIILIGNAGTGKSTLAQEIAKKVQVCYLERDNIADQFTIPRHNFMNEHYKEHVRLQSYAATYKVAEDNLMLGNSVIIIGPNSIIWDKQIQERILKTSEKSSSLIKAIKCYCPSEIIRSRLSKRGLTRDLPKLSSDDTWKNYIEQEQTTFDRNLPFQHSLNINTSSPDYNLTKVLEFLQNDE